MTVAARLDRCADKDSYLHDSNNQCIILRLQLSFMVINVRVATGQRKNLGKFDFSSRSGKSQGILQIGQGNFKYQESQGQVREFRNFGP